MFCGVALIQKCFDQNVFQSENLSLILWTFYIFIDPNHELPKVSLYGTILHRFFSNVKFCEGMFLSLGEEYVFRLANLS